MENYNKIEINFEQEKYTNDFLNTFELDCEWFTITGRHFKVQSEQQ